MPELTPRWDIFLAHAGADGKLAEQLYQLLSPDVRVFLDTKELQLGDKWDDELSRAQRESLLTVVLVSKQSEKAFYEKEEIASAIALSRKQAHRVVPIFVYPEDSEPAGVPYGLTRLHGLRLDEAQLGDAARQLCKLVLRVRAQELEEIKKAVKDAVAGEATDEGKPQSDSRQLHGDVDQAMLNRLTLTELMRCTGHSVLQKCSLDGELFVLKGTSADLCDFEALKELAPGNERFLPSDRRWHLKAMGTPRAVWSVGTRVWELQRYYNGKSLAAVMREEKRVITGSRLLGIAETIAEVLELLHGMRLVHRDINPDNILVLDGSNELRIVDWSWCCRESGRQSRVQTRGYTAPEQSEGKAGCPSDWYAFGATCFALANGFTIAQRGSAARAEGLSAISMGEGGYKGWNEQDFFRRLLSPSPKDRPQPWEAKESERFDIAVRSEELRPREEDSSWFERLMRRIRR